MFHIVYLTTNTINNKIYVGVHSTYKLNDGYIGTGRTFIKSVKKYGKENFVRTILYYCLNSEDAYEIEKRIVDKNFAYRNDTYNMVVGGIRSKGGIHSEETIMKLKNKTASDETRKKMSEAAKLRGSNRTGCKHSEATKQKIGEKSKGRIFPPEEIERRRQYAINKYKKN